MVLKGISGIVVLGLLLSNSLGLYGEDTGFKYLKNYSYSEYDHQPQNWGIVQDKNGIIYFANQGGVLAFDGVSWRVIGIPDYAPVRSLAIDEEGTVYIGGKGEIGYLVPDAKGTLIYYSLKGYLPNNKKDFSDVWKVYPMGKHVYFDTSKYLLRWDSGKGKFNVLPRRYISFLICGEKLFIQGEKTGIEQIVQIKNPTTVTISVGGGEEFSEKKKICIMAPYDSRKLLIGTYHNGLYINDGKTTATFTTEVDSYLKKHLLYHGIRLSSGDFALATLRGGLVIIDPHGRLKHIFDKTYGLQDEKVYYVFEDIQKNLWLGLDKGISKIEYTSPISIYDERSNLSGLVLSISKDHKDLYVGTTNGLYYLESPFKFHLITGISRSCWSLLSIENSILAATSSGVFQVDTENNTRRKVINGPSYSLLLSKQYPGRIWCGASHGLSALFKKSNQWIEEYRFETVKIPLKHIVEDKKGNLWLATFARDVLYVDFADNPDEHVVTPYGTSHGLPGGEIYPTMAAGHVMFATEYGLFKFDENSKTFIPDGTFGVEFAGGLASKPVFRIAEDKNKNIWFHSQSRNYQAVPGSGNSFTVESTPLRRIPLIQVNAIYPDPDGKTTWFASFEGLIRYDTRIEKNYRLDFPTLIRRVFANETLIFDGHRSKTPKDFFPVIEYRERNLQFEFAAPFFDAETKTRYRCFLEGYDDDWSDWNYYTKRSYTNLDAGMYTFRVQAKNVYELEGEETEFRFKILPPWFRTWWAYLFFAIVLILAMFFIVKWRFGKLVREKQRLEQIIKERTKDVNDKNQEMEKKTLQLND